MRALVTLVLNASLVVACGAPGPADTPSGQPGPTPEITATALLVPDPAAEMERIRELRMGWGLEADEDWVRQVAADPDSVESPLGIPVTQEEARQLQELIDENRRTALVMYGAREHEQFGGLWVNEPGVGIVVLFTGDLDRHRQALSALARGLPFEVRQARFTESELRALQMQLAHDIQTIPGTEMISVALDVRRNVVVLEAKSNDRALEARLEAAHAGRLDAQIYPMPGVWHNVPGGPGWRLVSAGTSRHGGVQPYSVTFAAEEGGWLELWELIAPGAAAPPVDLTTEIVTVFAEGIGSSCPEVRLDAIVIDAARGVVHGAFSDPLAPRTCTADLAGAAVFVVALSREALPDSPFVLRLHSEPMRCGDCPDEVTVDLSEP
jgi:hypothetical protein